MPEGTRVRLLWLSKETPDRFGQGGQRRQFFQLRALHDAGVRLTVLTPASEQDDSSIQPIATVIRYRNRRFGKPKPDPVELAVSSDFDRLVVAHAESLDLLRDRHPEIRIPWLVDFHNVQSRWYAEHGDTTTAKMWHSIEAEILRFAAACLTCAAAESDALRAKAPAAMVTEAPNGIDPAEWPDTGPGDRDPRAVAAYGSWWYPPNRDGLEWFLAQVWPAVRAGSPGARLLLAGTGEPPETAQRGDGVEVVGRVDSVPAFLDTVGVVAVPVLKGPGTPVKYAEALASGAAVAATDDAAEGSPDAPAVTSNDPAALADGIVRLLQHPEQATELGGRSRAYALRHCPWSVTQQPLVNWVLRGSFER